MVNAFEFVRKLFISAGIPRVVKMHKMASTRIVQVYFMGLNERRCNTGHEYEGQLGYLKIVSDLDVSLIDWMHERKRKMSMWEQHVFSIQRMSTSWLMQVQV